MKDVRCFFYSFNCQSWVILNLNKRAHPWSKLSRTWSTKSVEYWVSIVAAPKTHLSTLWLKPRLPFLNKLRTTSSPSKKAKSERNVIWIKTPNGKYEDWWFYHSFQLVGQHLPHATKKNTATVDPMLTIDQAKLMRSHLLKWVLEQCLLDACSG